MSKSEMVSVVLPCRNQADHIARVLLGYLESLEALRVSFELVVVPNASVDATTEVVAEIARTDSRVRVVENPWGGWGRSVRTGLDAASGDTLVYTNTARTDPSTLPTFIEHYFSNRPCLIKASRRARNSPTREIGSILYNIESWLLFGLRTRDVNGTPKVFARDLYQEINPSTDGDLLDLEIMVGAHRFGTRLIEIPVTGFSRHGGKSSTTLKSAWRMYRGAVDFWLKAS